MTAQPRRLARSVTRALAPLAAALALAGCATGPDYARPALDLPDAWAAAGGEAARPAPPTARWWTLYADPVLDRLVDEAFEHGADARIAAARVLEARARAGITDADRYPVVGANLGADRTRSSREATFPLPAGTPVVNNTYRATLDVAWEIDLWGKYRRASEAAAAEVFAAEAARDGVRLALAAEVAQQYFALLALDAQVATLDKVLAGRAETVSLMRQRLEAGIASELELRQAEAEVASARSQRAELQRAREAREAGLAVLLGRSPRAVMDGAVARAAPRQVAATADAPMAPSGLPSDLLLRRPDLREAEQRLVAANARIGAARAEYFPAVSLTGFVGSESADFGKLFSGPAGVFQFALGLAQPIFNAGRLGYLTAASEAVRDQALAGYRRAVANAFADVRNALAAQRAAHETVAAESARAVAQRAALALADQRYQAGLAGRLETLDAERGYLAAELARLDAERAGRAALADLVKALGGGWDAAAAPAAPHERPALRN
jgi:multidrug efflux system outer membrane protein